MPVPSTIFPILQDDEEDAVNDDLKYDSKRVLEQACEFFLFGEINRSTVEALSASMLKMSLVKKRKNRKPPFILHIHSNGGDVASGLALAATIQRIKGEGYKVVTRVEGMSASMGSVLSQFGDVRQIDALATWHMHDVQSFMWGDTGDKQDMGEWLQSLRLMVATVMAQRNTKGHNDPQWWIDNFLDRKNHYLTATQALELGAMDEIVGCIPMADYN